MREKRRGGEEYVRPQIPFTGEIQRFINQLQKCAAGYKLEFQFLDLNQGMFV